MSDEWQGILNHYRALVGNKYPSRLNVWPLLSGYDGKHVGWKGWSIFIYSHTGNSVVRSTTGLGDLPDDFVDVPDIDDNSRELFRERVEKHFSLSQYDGVILVDPKGQAAQVEFDQLLRRHELVLGLIPMKIFLSHKGSDKPLVKDFALTLRLLGFEAWLDEDDMPAGTALHRGILEGFEESCAAVFFVTPRFADEKYLEREVNYAISEKTKKGTRFAIITLVFGEGTAVGKVPNLLHEYVWKEPKTPLEALREIIRALPIRVGDVRNR